MSTKAKRKPIVVAVLVAIIIGIVCLVVYFNKYYQPELEMPPRLVVRDSSGELCELMLTSYDWTYKGERKTYNMQLDGKEISQYDYDIENIWFSQYFSNWSDDIVIATDPSYKNNGFVIKSYEYMGDFADLYEYGVRTDVEKVEPAEEFWFGSFSIGTSFHEITLNSDKQGMATYIFKGIDASNLALNKIKTIKVTNADELKSFFAEESGGQFLRNVTIEGDKVKLEYEYWISKDVSSDYACEIFALMDNINEVEFDFLHNKYVQIDYDRYEETEPQTTTFDDAIPVSYKREGFITENAMTIKELKDYIEK